MGDHDVTLQIVSTLKEIFSREERKLIPIFTGDDDIDVEEWLKEAEKVAISNEWSDEQKLRFFPDRLINEAFEFHLESKTKIRLGTNDDPAFSYDVWKQEIINRFLSRTDLEYRKLKLLMLKQIPNQRTKAFVSKLDKLYISAYGEAPTAPERPTANESILYESALKIRNEQKKKVLLQGLLPTIRNELWSRISENPSYDELCKSAYVAESILVQKELSLDGGIII